MFQNSRLSLFLEGVPSGIVKVGGKGVDAWSLFPLFFWPISPASLLPTDEDAVVCPSLFRVWFLFLE